MTATRNRWLARRLAQQRTLINRHRAFNQQRFVTSVLHGFEGYTDTDAVDDALFDWRWQLLMVTQQVRSYGASWWAAWSEDWQAERFAILFERHHADAGDLLERELKPWWNAGMPMAERPANFAEIRARLGAADTDTYQRVDAEAGAMFAAVEAAMLAEIRQTIRREPVEMEMAA